MYDGQKVTSAEMGDFRESLLHAFNLLIVQVWFEKIK